MTNASSTPTDSPPDDAGTAEHAKEQAKQVAETGRQQAGEVAAEAKTQTRQLIEDARSQARDRADGQVSQLAGMLDRVSNELNRMADAGSEFDTLNALVRDGSSTAHDLSQRLQHRGLDGAIDDLSRFARRRPVAFLTAAFGTGLLLGRVTRNADLEEVMSDDDEEPSGYAGRSAELDHSARLGRSGYISPATSRSTEPIAGEPTPVVTTP